MLQRASLVAMFEVVGSLWQLLPCADWTSSFRRVRHLFVYICISRFILCCRDITEIVLLAPDTADLGPLAAILGQDQLVATTSPSLTSLYLSSLLLPCSPQS